MTKIMTFTAITVALLSIPLSGFAFAAPWDVGEPFEVLSAALAELEQRVQALEQQISELTFTQTDPNETVIQVNMAANPTAPPLVVSDTDNNDVFTVFPDGAIRIGFNTVTINPDGSASGLEIKEENIPDKSIGAEKLKDKTIGQDKIKDKAIGKEKIQDKAIGRDKIEDKAVGKGQIADKAIGKGQLEDKAVGRGQLDDRSVGRDQLDENSVTSFHIEDGTVTLADVAPGIFVTIDEDETINGKKTFSEPLVLPPGVHLRSLTGVPIMTTSLSGPVELGDSTVFTAFAASSVGDDIMECLETKPDGTVIVIGFANSGTVKHGASCAVGNNLSLSDSIDFAHSAGDVLVLGSQSGSWFELTRIPS